MAHAVSMGLFNTNIKSYIIMEQNDYNDYDDKIIIHGTKSWGKKYFIMSTYPKYQSSVQ